MSTSTTSALAFDALIAPRPDGEHRFALDVPDGWQQGRGAFGGLVLAALARAVEADVADPTRPLRALAGELIGPVQPGTATVTVELLRVGSGATTASARLLQGGEVHAHAVVILGKARPTYDAAPTLPAPPIAAHPWRALPPAPVAPPLAPVFTQHIEYRLIGPTVFSGKPGVTDETCWVRLRDPGPTRDAAWLIAHIDTVWPVSLISARAPRPMATLAFGYQAIGVVDGLDPEAPLFYRAHLLAGRDGYVVESRELWGEDGRLLALNQQTLVVMK